mmetsp:Transcript_8896/g.18904  ORF Transcript_8896/g.18904 Transcript_8896/m.18904 type:complete len:198 (+) Transcript_8896:118-711(+)
MRLQSSLSHHILSPDPHWGRRIAARRRSGRSVGAVPCVTIAVTDADVGAFQHRYYFKKHGAQLPPKVWKEFRGMNTQVRLNAGDVHARSFYQVRLQDDGAPTHKNVHNTLVLGGSLPDPRNDSALTEFGTTNADGFQVAFVDNRESNDFQGKIAILQLLRHGRERCGHRRRCQVLGQLQGGLQPPGKHRELVRSGSR